MEKEIHSLTDDLKSSYLLNEHLNHCLDRHKNRQDNVISILEKFDNKVISDSMALELIRSTYGWRKP